MLVKRKLIRRCHFTAAEEALREDFLFPSITSLLETVTTFTCEPALKEHRIWKKDTEKHKQHGQGRIYKGKHIPYG